MIEGFGIIILIGLSVLIPIVLFLIVGFIYRLGKELCG